MVNSTNIAQKFKYQGQELEESLGYNMHEFQLRHYDAAIGRFVTTDPYEQFMSPYVAMGNNPVVSFDPDGGHCYDSSGTQIACPDDDIYDDYRDNPDKRIDIMDEVTVTADLSDIEKTKANRAYWREINASAEVLNQLATLNTGKTSQGRAEERERARARDELTSLVSTIQYQPQVTSLTLAEGPLAWLGGGSLFKISNIAGYYVRAKTLLQGGVYTKTIQSLASLKEGTSLVKLVKAIEAEAKASGAKQVIINGIDIVNPKIMSVTPAAAQKLGYTLEKGTNSIKLIKNLK